MASSLVFTVRRREPVLVTPETSTPQGFMPLSEIDHQQEVRYQARAFHFYPYNPSLKGSYPAEVVKKGIAKALVSYYPYAGRIREGTDGRLVVECTGEGVLFIEADADVTLEDFGKVIKPPFPCEEELLHDVEGSNGITNCPLMLFQVTRLKCGGFVFTLRANHIMSDAVGMGQFIGAIGELARGASQPSITPVWERHLLNARNPPHITCDHRLFDRTPKDTTLIDTLLDMECQYFFFDIDDVAAIRTHLIHNQSSTSFEVLAACIWKCRTIALNIDPDAEVRLLVLVNSRAKLNPPLPEGYYGNAITTPVAFTSASDLCASSISHAVELIKKAKEQVTDEYMRSFADLMAIRKWPKGNFTRTFLVSNVTRAGFGELDFGWGKPVYGGPAEGELGPYPGCGSFFIRITNGKGVDGSLVTMRLPAPAMDRFVREMEAMTGRTLVKFI